MGKVKYQLIKPEETAPSKPIVVRGYIKWFLPCPIIVLLIIIYTWPNADIWDFQMAKVRYREVLNPIYIANITPNSSTNPTTNTTAITTTYTTINTTTNTTKQQQDGILGKDHYVFTSKCRMPAVNPFSRDAMKLFDKIPYKKCDYQKDVIIVKYDVSQESYSLHINNGTAVQCCYKPILRAGMDDEADNHYKLLPCRYFQNRVVVPPQVHAAITECRNKKKKIFQRDAFSFMQPIGQMTNKSIENNITLNETIQRRPNILLWGIDSLSRINLQRTMPLTYKYLNKNWYQLQGYNKMEDNTFPNLMAVLTGYNFTRSQNICQPNVVGGLDACPFVWKEYKQKNYITGYAEDWSVYATFNHDYRGFHNPPTDFYGRALMLAIVKELKTLAHSGIPYCVGRRHYAEYVYDSAVDFTKVHLNQSNFGLFWTNSFSHNNFSLPSSMDAKMLEYMHTLESNGVYQNSIIFFFSDHGMRFGLLRNLPNGFLEERMPVMYIWLPEWFRQQYPQFVRGLEINRNRLTSPYDIYATLKHILELDTPEAMLPRPEGCPRCHSIFFEVSESRDCQEAGIEDHWCTCRDFRTVSANSTTSVLIINQLIEETHKYLVTHGVQTICHHLKLKELESIKREFKPESNNIVLYLVRYTVEPEEARFEATVKWNSQNQKISIYVPKISRLTPYHYLAKCVDIPILKKFCICLEF